MKMRKLFALGVAAMMTFSTVASAAVEWVEVDGDNYAFMTSESDFADITARNIAVDVDVNEIDMATAKTFGAKNWALSNKLNETNYKYYQVDVAVNVGDLIQGYVGEGDTFEVRLNNIQIVLSGLQSKQAMSKSTTADKAWNTDVNGYNSVRGGTVLSWDATDGAQPVSTDSEFGIFEEDYTATATYAIVMDKDATFDVTSAPTTITYLYSVGGTVSAGCQATATTITASLNGEDTGSVIKFAPKATAADPVEFSAALAEDTDFGYIWALTFTKSADKLATFTAKFEADGVEPAERTVANASAIATALAGKSAPVVLNVGLKTTKTLTKATFTADDADDTTAACVVVAHLSK